LKLLINLLRGEENSVIEAAVQNDRMELILRILNNLQEDVESIENAVQLLSHILIGEEMGHRFRALDGLTAL